MRVTLLLVLASACSSKAKAPPPAATDAAPPPADYDFPSASLTLPPLGKEWSVDHQRRGNVDTVTVFLGSAEIQRGYLAFSFYPRAETRVDPIVIGEQQVALLVREWPFLERVGEPERFGVAGGLGYAVQLAGTNPNGVKEILNVVAVGRGTSSVGIVIRGGHADMNGGAIEKIASPLLGGLKLKP
jgi:hypothetical protein